MSERNRILLSLLVLFVGGLLGFIFTPNALAGQWSERTIITTTGPLEIPGRVLSPGTYVFQLPAPGDNRNVLEITNKQTGKLVALIQAIPTYRTALPTRPIITLAERSSDNPPAVSKWFYPDQHYGLKFIYPHSERNSTAAMTRKSQPARG